MLTMNLKDQPITSIIINLEHDRVSFFTSEDIPGAFTKKTPALGLVTTMIYHMDSKVCHKLRDFLQESMRAEA